MPRRPFDFLSSKRAGDDYRVVNKPVGWNPPEALEYFGPPNGPPPKGKPSQQRHKVAAPEQYGYTKGTRAKTDDKIDDPYGLPLVPAKGPVPPLNSDTALQAEQLGYEDQPQTRFKRPPRNPFVSHRSETVPSNKRTNVKRLRAENLPKRVSYTDAPKAWESQTAKWNNPLRSKGPQVPTVKHPKKTNENDIGERKESFLKDDPIQQTPTLNSIATQKMPPEPIEWTGHAAQPRSERRRDSLPAEAADRFEKVPSKKRTQADGFAILNPSKQGAVVTGAEHKARNVRDGRLNNAWKLKRAQNLAVVAAAEDQKNVSKTDEFFRAANDISGLRDQITANAAVLFPQLVPGHAQPAEIFSVVVAKRGPKTNVAFLLYREEDSSKHGYTTRQAGKGGNGSSAERALHSLLQLTAAALTKFDRDSDREILRPLPEENRWGGEKVHLDRALVDAGTLTLRSKAKAESRELADAAAGEMGRPSEKRYPNGAELKDVFRLPSESYQPCRANAVKGKAKGGARERTDRDRRWL